jgi:class 3 adenylate cyclase
MQSFNAMRYAMQRPRLMPVILIAIIGLIAGIAFRAYIDEASEQDLANFVRSGLHGVGIALAAWTAQTFFASNAQSPLGAALRRLPLLGELVIRSLVMTVVIVATGLILQTVLYAEPLGLRWLTPSFFSTQVPYIIALGLAMSLIVGALTEAVRMIGGPMLASIALGTYRRPTRAQLIVMFLDIADSTRLAEDMGELRVHDLITRFFFDIEEPIVDHGGTVHAYVGDEVIVSWPVTTDRVRNARCLACFFAIERKMAQLAANYRRDFGMVPRFRAGLHAGTVIISECGSVKRQLAFFGDTMNVAARLCEYCKTAGQHLVVSGDLLRQVAITPDLNVSAGNSVALRGRQESINVHTVQQIVRDGLPATQGAAQ